MTVKELTEGLKFCPEGMEVWYWWEGDARSRVELIFNGEVFKSYKESRRGIILADTNDVYLDEIKKKIFIL
jgi:hypothetical protein